MFVPSELIQASKAAGHATMHIVTVPAVAYMTPLETNLQTKNSEHLQSPFPVGLLSVQREPHPPGRCEDRDLIESGSGRRPAVG